MKGICEASVFLVHITNFSDDFRGILVRIDVYLCPTILQPANKFQIKTLLLHYVATSSNTSKEVAEKAMKTCLNLSESRG